MLFVFSDGGGGREGASREVGAALRDLCGDVAHVDLVNLIAEYFPWPLSELDAICNHLARLRGLLWALTYHVANGKDHKQGGTHVGRR